MVYIILGCLFGFIIGLIVSGPLDKMSINKAVDKGYRWAVQDMTENNFWLDTHYARHYGIWYSNT